MPNDAAARTTIRGFTLIELLIVVAIIAILAAIAVPNFIEAQTRSKVSRSAADLRAVATAIESYRVDNNAYPRAIPLYPFLYSHTYCNYLTAYDSINKRNFGVWELTTPISYITSLPDEAFTSGRSRNGGAGEFARYGYGFVNFDSMSKSPWADTFAYPTGPGYGASPSLHLDYNSPGKVTKTNWLLVSNGPDAESNFTNIPSSGIRALVERTHDMFAVYDPTNGSISRGDIFRSQ